MASLTMTILDEARVESVGDAQLLFQEAKQRRRRRRLISGILSTLILLVVVGVALSMPVGRGRPSTPRPVGNPVSAAAAPRNVVQLSFRPLLCFASPLTLGPQQAAATGPLPSCAPRSQLNAANLRTTIEPGTADGFSTNLLDVPADPRFAIYRTTPPRDDAANTTVLLPRFRGGDRYVLGPAGLTDADIASAHATRIAGQWAVNLVLTGDGSAKLDVLTQSQFHQLIGVDLNGQVISTPITQPTQSSWTSFNGQVQIAGPLSEQQAKAIAARF
jgi:hypothetical protein